MMNTVVHAFFCAFWRIQRTQLTSSSKYSNLYFVEGNNDDFVVNFGEFSDVIIGYTSSITMVLLVMNGIVINTRQPPI
jgi:hypothetical protein